MAAGMVLPVTQQYRGYTQWLVCLAHMVLNVRIGSTTFMLLNESFFNVLIETIELIEINLLGLK